MCDRLEFRDVTDHGHRDETVSQETRTADGEDASLRDLHHLVDPERYGDTTHVGKHLGRGGNLTDLGAGEHHIGTLEKAAGVMILDGERIVFLHALPEAAEIEH